MKLTHSLRWRIQLWHGVLLLGVLVALGLAAYRYQRTSQLRRVDAELRERVALLMESLPTRSPGGPGEGGRPPGPPGPPARPGPPDDRPPGPQNFRLSGERAALFDPKNPGACYYVLWRRDGGEWARSAGAPVDIEMPERPPADTIGSVDRTRGVLHEAFIFTPPGECLLAGRSIEPELKALQEYARWLAAIGGGVLLLGLGGGWWLSARAIRPLDAITATAVRIADGRLDERIDVADTDSELGQLATVLNSTFARLESSFAQQAQFTADAAHELRTPVSVIISQAQLGLRGERSTAEYREMLEACLRAAKRMQKLTQSLLELARHDAGALVLQRESCDLASLAQDTADLLQSNAAELQITIELNLAPATCHADPDRIAQVILNLLTNALEHTPADGRVTVYTSAEGTGATLSISDTGPGIAPEHLPKVFDRFYRADVSRNRRTGGAGLGLAICKTIAEAHGGKLEVASGTGQGSTFTLWLPAA
ncbi:MAG TPA: ATP-binding protein [Chthoniobacteraceae bacterium]|nr:ATP-binding protein [Chthoniobacteraceae bacterium]